MMITVANKQESKTYKLEWKTRPISVCQVWPNVLTRGPN